MPREFVTADERNVEVCDLLELHPRCLVLAGWVVAQSVNHENGLLGGPTNNELYVHIKLAISKDTDSEEHLSAQSGWELNRSKLCRGQWLGVI